MKRSIQLILFLAAIAVLSSQAWAQSAPSLTQVGLQSIGQCPMHDANGDGICDICGQPVGSGRAAGLGQRAGRGRQYGPGDGSGNQGSGPRDGSGYGAGSGAGSGSCDGTGPHGRRGGGRGQGRGGRR
jgi:hypothetical protein